MRACELAKNLAAPWLQMLGKHRRSVFPSDASKTQEDGRSTIELKQARLKHISNTKIWYLIEPQTCPNSEAGIFCLCSSPRPLKLFASLLPSPPADLCQRALKLTALNQRQNSSVDSTVRSLPTSQIWLNTPPLKFVCETGIAGPAAGTARATTARVKAVMRWENCIVAVEDRVDDQDGCFEERRWLMTAWVASGC